MAKCIPSFLVSSGCKMSSWLALLELCVPESERCSGGQLQSFKHYVMKPYDGGGRANSQSLTLANVITHVYF